MTTATGERRQGGFTLIELMIVVAIIAILAGIGYPSYKQYVTRASREAAKSELLQLQNLQEKIYLNSNAYTTSMVLGYNGRSDGGLGVPTAKTSDKKYDLAVGGGANNYCIQANPIVGTSQEGDGIISVCSDGTKMWGTATW